MILDSQVFAAALQEGDKLAQKGNKKQDSKKNNVSKKKKVIDKLEI
jgi:hypothetical protein